MIQIFEKISDPEDFDKKLRKANVERDKILKDYSAHPNKKLEFKSSVYGAFKPFLMDMHNEKCAYCESRIETEYGAVEHYRPKGKIVNPMNNKAEDHPGYYWKAFDWDNFLLSCTKCNTGFKRNYFPVSGSRATKPADNLKNEHPLILNPRSENPNAHISLDDSGNVKTINNSAAGTTTIKLMSLNRENLIENRRRAIKRGRKAIYDYFVARENNNEEDTLDAIKTLKEICNKLDQYNMASTYGLIGALKRWKLHGVSIDIKSILQED